ncbi:hypothetical protein CDLVIII_3073 [Clostridium sp. DL-VIII]|nr:hypothetical protein CDLVIII_3073 [Clostridium sp. DL-VIII]
MKIYNRLMQQLNINNWCIVIYAPFSIYLNYKILPTLINNYSNNFNEVSEEFKKKGNIEETLN